MGSIRRRVFPKRAKPQGVLAPLSLKEKYQPKVQRYLQILTASDAALEIMAQMQASREGEGCVSPAYVQVSSTAVLRHTGDAVRTLQEFSRDKQKPQELGEIFAILANRVKEELPQGYKANVEAAQRGLAASRPLLNLDHHLLGSPELLASGLAYLASDADAMQEVIIEGIQGWKPATPAAMGDAQRYRVTLDQAGAISSTETVSPPTRPESSPLERQPLLQETELKLIVDYVRQLTADHQCPQRVEWGLGAQREIVVLRSLPYPPPPGRNSAGPGAASGSCTFRGDNHLPRADNRASLADQD